MQKLITVLQEIGTNFSKVVQLSNNAEGELRFLNSEYTTKENYETYTKSVGSLYTLKPKALQKLLTRRGKLYYKALQTYGVPTSKIWYDGTVLSFEV